MVQSATALLASGAIETACRALVYLVCSQHPDRGFAQNFWIDLTPYWGGIQLDEVVCLPGVSGKMFAWRLWKAGALEGVDPYQMVRAGASFLIRHGPGTQQERWKSPSLLATTIAALTCTADFARDRGEPEAAAFLEEYADFLESHIEEWTVTTAGTLVRGVSRHYIRITPVDIDNPEPAEDPNCGVLAIRNRAPGERVEFPAKEVVDAGILELVRYGTRHPGDVLIEDSLALWMPFLRLLPPSALAGTGITTTGRMQLGVRTSALEKGGFGRY